MRCEGGGVRCDPPVAAGCKSVWKWLKQGGGEAEKDGGRGAVVKCNA